MTSRLRGVWNSIRKATGPDPERCPNHARASSLPTLACAHCQTFKWNGFDMCGKVCDVSPIKVRQGGRLVPSYVHACTRKAGHSGSCQWHKLTDSYEPS